MVELAQHFFGDDNMAVQVDHWHYDMKNKKGKRLNKSKPNKKFCVISKIGAGPVNYGRGHP